VGRVLVVSRLAARDLRRRPAEAALLLLAITAATTTLTLGLVLHGVTTRPYQSTRAATHGPDVVAEADPPLGGGSADRAGLAALARAPGVTGHSGPYPLIGATLRAHGGRAALQVQGRDGAPATIDQPKLTAGSWVRDGGVVIERGFADAFDVHAGDRVTVDGRRFVVAGIAVTAASAPYPSLTLGFGPRGVPVHPGLAWLTRADVRRLAPNGRAASSVINLRLADPAAAPAFADAHMFRGPMLLLPWQEISEANGNLVRNERKAMLTGSWLLALLALASIAVLVGGRMADQIRRVGLLKAVGATPRLIASVLLAQYVVLALLAAALGLAAGRLTAPVLTDPGSGLIGSSGAVPFTLNTVALVTAVALAVAVVATFIPAVRASRISTVLALADSARAPRRAPLLIAVSARLPVPLLLGLRVAARRPRRTVLCLLSTAVTVSGIVTALAAHAQLEAQRVPGSAGLADPRADRLGQVLALITVLLVVQAAVDAIFIAWATVLDARHASALARALGATPGQVGAGLTASQVLPALAGALLGVPGGLALFAALSDDASPAPSPWWLVATVLGTVLAIAALTAIPARLSARRPVAPILQSELA
jgi:ABC-type lipoprotein release transport system permease subunit